MFSPPPRTSTRHLSPCKLSPLRAIRVLRCSFAAGSLVGCTAFAQRISNAGHDFFATFCSVQISKEPLKKQRMNQSMTCFTVPQVTSSSNGYYLTAVVFGSPNFSKLPDLHISYPSQPRHTPVSLEWACDGTFLAKRFWHGEVGAETWHGLYYTERLN